MRIFDAIISQTRRTYRWAAAKPSLRVLAYLTFLGVLSSLWLTHRASALVTEQMLANGRGLSQLLGALGNATTLQLNGHEFVVTSARTKRSVGDAMQEFGKSCVPYGGSQRLRVFNFQTTETEAAAFCFVERAGIGATGKPLLQIAEAYAKSGDLGELGQPRYLFARKERENTVVVQVEAPSHIRLDVLLPDGGDAVGEDVPFDLKPPGTTRTLAAAVPGTPHGVALYESAASLETVGRAYVEQAQKQGYTVKRTPADQLANVLLLEKESRMYVVELTRGEDGLTRLTSSSLGAGAKAVAEAAR